MAGLDDRAAAASAAPRTPENPIPDPHGPTLIGSGANPADAGTNPGSAARAPPTALRQNWRKRLRDDCLTRVRANRQALLRRVREGRGGAGGGSPESDIHAVLAGIVRAVSGAQADRGGNAWLGNGSHSRAGDGASGNGAALPERGCGELAGEWPRASTHTDPLGEGPLGGEPAADDLWEAAAPVDARQARRQHAAAANGLPHALFELEGDEFEALVADMEAALLEAALRDEADALAAGEAADVAGLVESFQQQRLLDSPRVPCPVCQAGVLRQHRGAVLCAGCGLRLDLAGEGLGLEHVREQLANALAGHALFGCTAPAAFAVEQRFGAATLFMRCDACSALQAVV